MGRILWRGIRGRFLPASLVSILVSAAIVRRQWAVPLWPGLPVVFLGGALVHAGGNLWNDYADDLNGTDRANSNWTPFNGGSRVIQDGLLRANAVRLAAVACFAAAMGIALALMPERGLGVPLLTLFGILCALGYSSPPVWLAGRGLGEAAVGFAFGPLLSQGTAVVLSGRFSPAVFAVSIPLGLLVAAILTINEIPDLPADRTAGKRTLVVRRGAAKAVAIYRGLITGAFLSLGFVAALGPSAGRLWPGLLAGPLGLWLVHGAGRVGPAADEAFRRTAAGTIALHLVLGTFLVLGISLW